MHLGAGVGEETEMARGEKDSPVAAAGNYPVIISE